MLNYFSVEWFWIREKEDIWLSPMTKAPTPTDNNFLFGLNIIYSDFSSITYYNKFM